MEADLQEQLSLHLHFTKLKCCQKRQVLKVISHVALALTISEIIKFKIKVIMCYFRNGIFVGKYSNLLKLFCVFCVSSHCFRDINIKNFSSSKSRSRSWIQFSQLNHSMKNVKIYKCLHNIFVVALTSSEIYKF